MPRSEANSLKNHLIVGISLVGPNKLKKFVVIYKCPVEIPGFQLFWFGVPRALDTSVPPDADKILYSFSRSARGRPLEGNTLHRGSLGPIRTASKSVQQYERSLKK